MRFCPDLSLADLFIPTPTRLIWEAVIHAAITAQQTWDRSTRYSCTCVLEYIFEILGLILILIEIMVMDSCSYSCSKYSDFTSTLQVHLSTFSIWYYENYFISYFIKSLTTTTIISKSMVANCITCICIKLTKVFMFLHASQSPMFSNIGSLKHLLCQFYCNNHDINCNVTALDL